VEHRHTIPASAPQGFGTPSSVHLPRLRTNALGFVRLHIASGPVGFRPASKLMNAKVPACLKKQRIYKEHSSRFDVDHRLNTMAEHFRRR